MKPVSTVIYFTIASGAGYGMIVVLSILSLIDKLDYIFNAKIIIISLSFFLIASGLLTSTIHLGHPERALRTLGQWRKSWLSRKVLLALSALGSTILFYYSWLALHHEILLKFFLIFSALLSILTVYCTAKIYSSLKNVPTWNNPFVPVLYILYSVISGSLILFLIFFYYKIYSILLNNFILILLPTAFFIKILYWYTIKNLKISNIKTTKELNSDKEINFFEDPSIRKNFLTNEIISNIDNKSSFILRSSCIILTYITPFYCLIQTPTLVVNDDVAFITYLISNILAIVGIIIERWLFFIESKHTVSLYYRNNAI